jgi:tetratricopeptide (TPR) repeat protein
MTDMQLDILEAKGLIRLATLDPELEYLFRHALVQDTAYDSLLKQERRALHRLVGDALEQLYPERRADLAAVLAMHFEQAGDTERAVAYLMSAAQFAWERNAVVEAFDLYSRAAATLPTPADDESEETLRNRVEIGIGQARTGFSFLDRNSQVALVQQTIANAERLGDLRLIGDAHLYNVLLLQFEGDRAETNESLRKSLERVTQVAETLKDPLFAALPKSIIGLSQVFAGEHRAGIAALEEAAPLLAQKRDFVGSSFALMAIGVGYGRLGEFEKADAALKHAKEVAEGGDIIARIDTMIGESMVEVQRGNLESAIPLAQLCTTMAEDAGATACVVGSNLVLGESLMRRGEFQGAKIALDRSHDVAEVTNQRQFKPSVAALRRSAAASLGDFNLAGGRSFEEALDEARAMHDLWAQANIPWLRAKAERSMPAPDWNKVFADYASSAAQLAEIGARPGQARVLRDWGTALAEAGDGPAGEEKLRNALALFEEMGLTREATEVRDELAAAA